MKIRYFLLLFTLSLLGVFFSCIKEEALFREVDIEEFVINDDNVVNVVIKDTTVTIMLRSFSKTVYTPQIKVSQGATISPDTNIAIDFSKQVKYTVVSEDKQYQKTYTVVLTGNSLLFDFENWYEVGVWKYPALNDEMWSTANSGVALAKVGNVTEYPTRRTTDCVSGKYAALLETQKGGVFWGNKVNLFSGSLFRGTFVLNMADFIKSTRFGQIYPKESGKPLRMTGYYKYTPGQVYTDKNGNTLNQTDEFSLYTVIYKVTKGKEDQEYLDGSTIKDSDKIIARAEVTDRTPKAAFTKFNVEFVYKEDFDYNQYNYKMAVVFASSREGNSYEGAVGSVLIVDDVEIVTDNTSIK